MKLIPPVTCYLYFPMHSCFVLVSSALCHPLNSNSTSCRISLPIQNFSIYLIHNKTAELSAKDKKIKSLTETLGAMEAENHKLKAAVAG